MHDHRSISPLPKNDAGHSARLSSDNISLDNFSTSETHLRAGSLSHKGPGYSTLYPKNDDLSNEFQPSSNLRTSTRRRKYQERFSHFGWWWEVYATLLAVASTAAIIAVLISVNAKPLEWWPLPIQPNSLVAVFSTIAKSALLIPVAECLSQLKWHYFEKPRALSQIQVFDDASRGPWGALKLLWTTRLAAPLASVGAFVMLLMLAFEPFTQQVIQFYSTDSLLRNETGTIFYTHSLSDSRFAYGASDGRRPGVSLTLAMVNALAVAGKSTSGRSLTYPSNEYCPAKSCTFHDFTSLGACTTCESEQVLINNEFGCKYYVRFNGTGNEEERQEYAKLPDFQRAVRQNMSTLNYYGMDCNREKEGYPTFAINLEVSAANKTGDLQGMGRQQGSSSSADLKVGEVFGTTGMIVTRGSAMGPGQFNGSSFSFCASSFERQIEGKNATFDTIDTFTCLDTNWWLGDIQHLDVFGEFNATLSWCSLKLCALEHTGVTISNQQLDGMGGATVHFNTKPMPLKKEGSGGEFANDTIASAEGTSDMFVIGPKSTSDIARILETTLYSDNFQGFMEYARFEGNSNPSWEDILVPIGQVVSSHIRSNENPNARNLTGSAFGPQIFVGVRWVWLTLPLSLVLFSILFLILTALQSSGKPYLFKSSILATMLYGLEGGKTDGLQTTTASRETGSDLAKLATGVQAVLLSNEDGTPRFVRQR